ncbi:class I SAM-dependent methyltransferase [Pseudomonas syringae]|nr:class I SAM-dependent methyltransferase [Pseudomonas syringae]
MIESKSLQDLYMCHQGFVSDKWSLYISVYSRLFSAFREKPINLLEIGVQNGGSLDIWSQYFPNAAHIVGCDINPACAQLEYASQTVAISIGDINQPETLASIFSITDEFNIIIDDGSHVSSDIIKSFSNLFSHLSYGGLYVAEDLHCGYWADYEGGLNHPTSCISFFKALSDIVNHEHWGLPVSRLEWLSDFGITASLSEELLSEIYSVEFVNSICIVQRKKASETQLGARVVMGDRDLVVPVHHLNGSVSQAPAQSAYIPPADAQNNSGTHNENPVTAESKHDKKDNEFAVETANIVALEAEKLRLREQLQVIETQLALIIDVRLENGTL